MDPMFTIERIKEKLNPIFTQSPIVKAVLFGSYATGVPTKKSDVDLLIDSNGTIRGIDFFGILEDISETLNVPIDLVEASQIIKGSRVQHEIDRTGVIIYERV
ncbi:MAG: nucleotidyltransferase domain-containing protein [Oscillospiraceae bacterium]|jgi:predicted nucleotidyltransferase|nr:nucleotidyltransferase domain-containing protein [Oscillospiraceae bacterium]